MKHDAIHVRDEVRGLVDHALADHQVEPRLRAGSLILADNADHAPDYLARVRGPGYVSVPFADDIELSMRL